MTFKVTDSFEIRPGMTAITHAPGVVVVFDAAGHEQQVPTAGSRVRLVRPDGDAIDAVVSEVRAHDTARSLYFEGLTKMDAPIGTTVSLDDNSAKHGTASSAATRP
jgi:hypothetical protein